MQCTWYCINAPYYFIILFYLTPGNVGPTKECPGTFVECPGVGKECPGYLLKIFGDKDDCHSFVESIF
jgi:hypothetical protein